MLFVPTTFGATGVCGKFPILLHSVVADANLVIASVYKDALPAGLIQVDVCNLNAMASALHPNTAHRHRVISSTICD